jgi:hypothetical protein
MALSMEEIRELVVDAGWTGADQDGTPDYRDADSRPEARAQGDDDGDTIPNAVEMGFLLPVPGR